MRSILWGIVLLSGCGLGNNSLYTASASEKNVYNLSTLSLGMSEREVLEIMRQPYSHQSFQIQEDSYDVWFYVTSLTGLGQTRMVSQNLTPLTFKNGELVGWGFNYYNWLVQQEKLEQQGTPEKKQPETEDTNLEKTLKTQPAPKSQPAPAKKTISLSSEPKEGSSEDQEEGDNEREGRRERKENRDESKQREKESPPFNKEDRETIEEESEQDFNYW